MFAPAVVFGSLGRMMTPLTLEAGRKQGEEVATQAKFVPGGFFFSGCTWKSNGVYTQCVCQVTIERYIPVLGSAFLNGNRLCPLFLLKYSFKRAMLQLEFQESKSKLKQSHLSQRNRRYAVCTVGGHRMCGRLPIKKLGFLAVQLWPIFF